MQPTPNPPTQTAVDLNIVQILWDYRNNSGFGFVVGAGVVLVALIAINTFYEKFVKPLNASIDNLIGSPPDDAVVTQKAIKEAIEQVRLEYQLREQKLIREYDTLIEQEKIKTDLNEIKSMLANLNGSQSNVINN